jgi:transcriptional regulator with XRE-family HTH domain
MTAEGKAAARELAREFMHKSRLWTAKDLAEEAGIHVDTATSFLNGEHWPRPGTLSKIEAALRIEPPGSLLALAEGNVAFLERAERAQPARASSVKTLEDASDIELLSLLLQRAAERADRGEV